MAGRGNHLHARLAVATARRTLASSLHKGVPVIVTGKLLQIL
jgi:hypothetical protein